MFALAALAATGAFAQSTVQIVGTFDPSVANQKYTYANGNSVTQTGLRNNSQGTSQITFKGTEDLGGGLKASFLYENDFNARFDANGENGFLADQIATKTNFGSAGGEQFLALAGGFGTIALGAPNTPTLDVQASKQPFSTKIGGGFGASGFASGTIAALGTGHVRNNNTIKYTSPTIAGFTASLAFVNKTNADLNATATGNFVQAKTAGTGSATGIAEAGSVTDFAVMYANGPLSAGYSIYVNGTTASVTQTQTQNNLFASYDLGVAKLTAGYVTEKRSAYSTTAAIDAKGYNVAAAIPLNANLSLLGNYAKLDDNSTTNIDKQISAIGLKYTLSKMSSVYARYVSEKNSGTLTGVQTKEVTTALVGMQTNF